MHAHVTVNRNVIMKLSIRPMFTTSFVKFDLKYNFYIHLLVTFSCESLLYLRYQPVTAIT